jgi:hypothetical protein
LTMRLYSQIVDTDSLKIVKSHMDSIYKVQVIPDNVLTGEFDLLITGFEKESNKKINTNIIEISWSSMYVDGRYILVITPRQIYLRSSHDNPNPNFLYWVTASSNKQFELIKHYLEKQTDNGIRNYSSENSTCLTYFFDKAEIEKYKRNNWTNKRFDNFLTLMNLINEPLEENGEQILIPSRNDFDNNKILRLVIDIYELQGQIKMIKIE